MKILVTGATGFIGQHVIRNLMTNPHVDIVATTRSIKKASSLDFFSAISFVEVDLSLKDEKIFYKLGSPDLMIHLAWDDLSNIKSLIHIEKNLLENYWFVKNIINGGLKDMTITGTCLEYGMQTGKLSEGMSAFPTNAYGVAKDSLRKFIDTLALEKTFSFKWLRLFYMYGEGQSATSLISLVDQAIARGDNEFNMSKGDQLRDYLPVELVADYIVKCSLQKSITGIINCSSGKPTSVKSLVENYLEEKNYKLKLNLGIYPYPDYEPMEFWGDNTKLNGILKR